MLSVEYGVGDFEQIAWAAIDRREPIQIVVKGDKRALTKKALSRFREYFDARRRGQNRRGLLMRFGWYAIRMPAFWGIHNHAELAGMQIATEDREGALLVTFSPAEAVPAGTSLH